MTVVLLYVILQSVVSTLIWLGFYIGIRAQKGNKSQQRRWIVGSAFVVAAWFTGIVLVASNGGFSPQLVPATLLGTLAVGYLLLLSPTFRSIIAGIPQHWLIGIQTFRIVGGVFLIRYFEGQAPGLFALPAGVGDVLTGILAPLVAYWWVVGKPYARRAAIAWNLFGMADLINAVTLGLLVGGGARVFPFVLIPLYGVPRAFLMHSYSLIGLLGKASRQPDAGELLHYGVQRGLAS